MDQNLLRKLLVAGAAVAALAARPPQRIELKRTKGWRMPPNTVKVDRSTRWGNPSRIGDEGIADAAHAVATFRAYTEGSDASFYRAHVRSHLAGRNLACWCKLGEPCHADVLLELANLPPAETDPSGPQRSEVSPQAPDENPLNPSETNHG